MELGFFLELEVPGKLLAQLKLNCHQGWLGSVEKAIVEEKNKTVSYLDSIETFQSVQ